MLYFIHTLRLIDKGTFYLVEDDRIPVVKTDLEEARRFVQNNSCDWQEEGFYNFTHIQSVEENQVYPDFMKRDGQFFYECGEVYDWISFEISEEKYVINGKPVLAKNGTAYRGVEIG